MTKIWKKYWQKNDCISTNLSQAIDTKTKTTTKLEAYGFFVASPKLVQSSNLLIQNCYQCIT